MSSDEYGEVAARYYDAAYAHDQADVAFYAALARETGGPVLEIGCGTGRVLLPIARTGVDAVGIDRSPAMLAALRAKGPPPTLRLVTAAMDDFDLGGERFRLAYSAFRAFQHLETVEEQLRCLVRVRRHLLPGGRFAFDVFAPDLARLAQPEEPEAEEMRFEHAGETVVRYAAVTRDLATQTMEVRYRYERRRGDAVVGEDRQAFRMRWFHRYELEHLLARTGFEVEAVYADFDRRPYDGRDEIVVVARTRG